MSQNLYAHKSRAAPFETSARHTRRKIGRKDFKRLSVYYIDFLFGVSGFRSNNGSDGVCSNTLCVCSSNVFHSIFFVCNTYISPPVM